VEVRREVQLLVEAAFKTIEGKAFIAPFPHFAFGVEKHSCMDANSGSLSVAGWQREQWLIKGLSSFFRACEKGIALTLAVLSIRVGRF
jgi:hypothetical protein